ncbi:MAG TPA: hypothetical protein VK459_05750 [Polyangiaceae bacterium]|nr:hypothetical protein [Polyangiaceae bacterium]
METLGSIAELIKVIVAKISALFDVFDVSFFVSGGACMLAFAYLRTIYGDALPYPGGALAVAAAIVGSYISGLLCFAAGRWLRRTIFGRPWQGDFEVRLGQAMRTHGLDEDATYAPYFKRHARWRDVYPRLWAEVRQADDLKASFDLLRSYWVRSAVYDGLLCVLVIWGLAIGLALREPNGLANAREVGFAILGFLGIGLVACSREAARSDEYQIDEIAATLAYARDRRAEIRASRAASEAKLPPASASLEVASRAGVVKIDEGPKKKDEG